MFTFVVSVVSKLPDYDWANLAIQASGPAYYSCHRITICAQAVTMSEASCFYQYCYNCQ